jgi:hypothetical protein
VTIDYDGEQAAPAPASAVLAKFLRRSFSVADILKRGLRGWLFGLIGLVAGFFFGIYSIWTTPPTYSVSIGLLPTDSDAGLSIGDSGGGGLAALAGLVGMGGGPIPKFTRFVSALNTTSVAKIMDKKYDMICRTFAGDCDVKTHTWRKHTGFAAWQRRTLANLAHLRDPDAPRTPADLADYTESQVVISSDRTSHILTLTMDTRDAKFATLYLSTLVKATNDFVKAGDLSTVGPIVAYLNAKLATTNLTLEQHDALVGLLVDQERRLMLSSVDVPYAALIQDGPNVSSSNGAMRMLAMDTLIGLVLGLGLGIAGHLWMSGKRGVRRGHAR